MAGTVFPFPEAGKWALGAFFVLALAAAPLHAQDAEDAAPAEAGDIVYELSDPVDSPPVNFRSDVDADFDTPQLNDAEMYAEEYERRQREDKIRKRDQIERIQNFSAGAVTTDGVTTDTFGR
ncbi:hypothetical protein Plav_0382 [Parvibaculum lavamentivorans DS-1]|uniref:Uncharacterized protein n=1 Tax=Parvibaculum lavamentivorans (strain DS-1 / DSM 13023 / NCIMB 13966) TaxID=402881 RepID=A7HQ22_PARL1|nr:hypothetical protein [Parvibaculum lavamentivorans]ABS62005.1 hypothetical protein Plav_0382 [Parvibaculum lavamentivorans DS-1]